MIDNNDNQEYQSDNQALEICQLFDKDSDETIYASDLIEVIKALGVMFTDENVKIIERFQEENKQEKISFEVFFELYEKLMQNKKAPSEEEQELLSAFEFFDGENKGYIEADYFKKAVMSFGNKLTEDEVKHLFANAVFDKSNKNFNYKELIKVILEMK